VGKCDPSPSRKEANGAREEGSVDAEALRLALAEAPDNDATDDGDDPVTVAGRKLGEKLKLDVAAEGR
jgi:hypothetical protein